MPYKKILKQPRVEGGRNTLSVGATKRVERAIEYEMNKYGVSRPFVIHTCVAFALGIDDEWDYKTFREQVDKDKK